MRYLPVMIGLIMFTGSCKKETIYEYQIGLRNLTDKNFQVRVYPKAQYIHGDYYKNSSSDGESLMEFPIEPGGSESLFSTTKLQYEPSELLTEVFDSLIINLNPDSALIIKFNPDYVENYKINMFIDNSNWAYIKLNIGEKTSFNTQPFVSYQYNFEIMQDSLGN